jgi:HSP20 family protein
MSFMDPFFGGFGLDPFFGSTSGFPGREFWRQPTTVSARGVRGPSQQELLSAPVRGIDLPTDNWWRPRSDLFLDEENNEIRVEIELPGISFENINLECDGNSLVVSSYKAHTRKEDRGLFYLTERHFGNFYRRLDLPSRVDADRVEAHIKDGVLKITLPILASSGRRTRIPVSSTTETKRIEVPSAGGEGPSEFTPGAVPPTTFGQASEGATGISKEEASRGTTGKTGTEGVTAITGAVPSTVGPEVQGAKKAGTATSTGSAEKPSSASLEEGKKEQGTSGVGGEKKSFRMD